MQAYESIFIVRPSVTDEEVTKMVEKMKGVVEKNGGAISKAESWGKKKLAYNVNKEKKGTYVILRFTGDGKLIQALEHSYGVEDSVIKFLTVRVVKGDTGVLPSQTAEGGAGEGRPHRFRAPHDRDDRRPA
ncbi:MAG TPA: 30S ribosomal protein S6 [Nitrospiria bacterium]